MKKITLWTMLLVLSVSCTNKTTDSTTPTTDSTTQINTTMNPVQEAILTRVSVREFTGEKISDQQLDSLLQAAMAAPSAMNHQPWAFVVITEDSLLQKIGEAFPYSRCGNKPACAIIPCGDLSKAMEGEAQAFWINDVSAATENILLSAHAMGLGAVWTGVHPNSERVSALQALLSLPEYIIPLCIVPVGVPAEEPEPKQKYTKENIHWNSF